MSDSDLIGVVEAAYDLEPDLTGWASGVCHAAHPLLDEGLGVSVHVWTTRPDGRLALEAHEAVGMSPDVVELGSRYLEQRPVEMSQAVHMVAGPCASLSQVLGPEALGPRSAFGELHAHTAIRDVMGLKGTDIDGSGVAINIPLPSLQTPSEPFFERWSRVAAHLAAGYRLRRRLAEASLQVRHGEAVLEPDGRVVHAEGEARSQSAREVLRGAVRQIERARTDLRADEPEALELWRALVEGRWSVVDSYESDGRRLVVARRNEPRVRDPRGLSARESQVAAYASHGHSNKMIAYLLGVSESSVAAHLKSALSKLGVTSRVELTRLFHSAPS